MVVYKVEGMKPDARTLAELVYASALEVEAAVRELRSMKNADAIRARCRRINQLETTPISFYAALSDAFSKKKRMPAPSSNGKRSLKTLKKLPIVVKM